MRRRSCGALATSTLVVDDARMRQFTICREEEKEEALERGGCGSFPTEKDTFGEQLGHDGCCWGGKKIVLSLLFRSPFPLFFSPKKGSVHWRQNGDGCLPTALSPLDFRFSVSLQFSSCPVNLNRHTETAPSPPPLASPFKLDPTTESYNIIFS